VKIGAKDLVNKKWQHRWDITTSGRHFYGYKPQVMGKTFLDQPTPVAFKAICQLQTGYSCLNDYRKKVNQHPSNRCDCGEPETVEHYLFDCPLYDVPRQQLQLNLANRLGIWVMDVQILLEFDEDEYQKDWRETIVEELEKFILESNHFSKQ